MLDVLRSLPHLHRYIYARSALFRHMYILPLSAKNASVFLLESSDQEAYTPQSKSKLKPSVQIPVVKERSCLYTLLVQCYVAVYVIAESDLHVE